MKKITIETIVESPIDKVWQYWNEPQHIEEWAHASSLWECPYAENDLKVGGKFLTRMSAIDGSESFDLVGTYTNVIPNEKIEYILEDDRTVSISFKKVDDTSTQIIEEFEMESENSEEMQRSGWQAILDNFKKHTETN